MEAPAINYGSALTIAVLGSLSLSLTAESASLLRELDKSSRAVNKFSKDSESVGGGLSRGIGIAQKALGALGGALAAVSFTNAVRGAIETADALGDVAERVGVTVEQLQALRLQAEQTGGSAMSLDAGLEQFVRRLGEASQGTGDLAKVLQANNIALTDAAGNARPAVEVLSDLAEVAQAAGSAQERAALAADIFGRSGVELVGVLAGGSEAIQAFSEQSETLGQTSTANAKAASDAQDALTRLATATQQSLQPALLAVAPAVTAIADGITSLITGFRALDPETQKIIAGAGLFLAAVVPLAAALAPLALAVVALASPIGLIVAGLVGAGGLIAALVIFRKEIGEALLGVVNRAVQSFVGFRDAAIEAVKGLVEGVKQWLGNALAAAFKAVTAPIEQAKSAFKGLYNYVVGQSVIPDMVTEVGGWMERLEPAMVEPAKRANALTAEQFNALPKHIRESLNESIGEIEGWQEKLAEGPIAGEQIGAGLADSVSGSFSSALDDVAGSFNRAFQNILDEGVTSFQDLADAGKRIFVDLSANIGQALGTAFGGPLGGAFGSIFGSAAGVAGLFGLQQLGGLLGIGFGGPTGRNATIGGRGSTLGSISGTGLAAEFVRGVDDQVAGILSQQQQRIANRALAQAGATSVKFAPEGLSENDMARLIAGRITPIAQALGFRGVSTNEQLQSAIATQRAVEDATGSITPLRRQILDLRDTFDGLKANAKAFGISTEGLSRSLRQAEDAARDAAKEARQQASEQARATRVATRARIDELALSTVTPFEQVLTPLRDFSRELSATNLNPLQQFQALQEQFESVTRLARGGNLAAIADLQNVGQQLIQQAGTVGASPAIAAATEQVASAVADVIGRIEKAQDKAQTGIEDAVKHAERAIVDTVKELVNVSRDNVAEIKKLRRS